MNISRYIRTRALRLLTASAMSGVLGMALLLSGCAADEFDALREQTDYSSDTQLLITLAIPQGEMVPSILTRSEDAPSTVGPEITGPSQAPTTDELKINSLRLYIFPWNNPEAAPVVNRPLLIPSEMPVNPNRSVTYEIYGLQKGVDYGFYILANFGEDATSFANSGALDTKIINYASDAHKLIPGNLPMVYKSSGPIMIDPDATTPLKRSISLEYACVKLRYNIIFDKSDETHKIDGKSAKDNFGNNKLTPETVTLTNVTKGAKIIWDNTPSFYTATDNTLATTTLSGYGFYPEYIYTKTPTTGDRSNVSDEYTVSGTAFANASAAGSADKWILQGMTYVPERYVTDFKDQMGITFKSKLNGATDCEHSATIGDGDQLSLERGTYYEFTGHIVDPGIMVFTCDVRDWESMTIDTDFVSTYLTLSSTETYVDSFENGIITYDTDGRGDVKFECSEDAKVNGKDLFELAPATASTQHQLEIRVNSNVNISEVMPKEKLSSENGVACYITVGNIKKEILVKYDIKPFFTITPTSLKIQEGDGLSDDGRYFTYRTNMGGFTLTPSDGVNGDALTNETTGEKTYTVGDNEGNVKLSLGEGASASSGIIKIGYKIAPTTRVYEFTATSKEPYDRAYETASLKIEVLPSKTKYRIYFRAINDYQANDNDEFLHHNNYVLPAEFRGTGDTNNNWIDYWSWENDSRNKNTPTNDMHRLYAYTQYGQDANTQPVWLYTAPFNGQDPDNDDNTHNEWWMFDYGGSIGEKSANMESDNTNPGWYYYDIPISCNGVPKKGAGVLESALQEKYGKGPLPGATLLIFYNTESKHRVNFDNAPGIPLGDDNDNETWVLFDPSRDPVYTVYNDKPYIEDVTYTIYSDVDLTAWRRDYSGHNIHGSLNNTLIKGSTSGDYTQYTLRMKAPKGEYDKAINLLCPTSTPSFYFVVPENADWQWKQDIEIHFKNSSNVDYTKEWTSITTEGGMTRYEYKFTNSGILTDAIYRGIAITGAGDYRHPQNGYTQLDGKYSQEIVVGSWSLNNVGGVLLFNGRNWRTGYFKGGKWSSNP